MRVSCNVQLYLTVHSRSASSNSSTDSDSDSEPDLDHKNDKGRPFSTHTKPEELAMDDDEDGQGGAMTADQACTKNEVTDVKIAIPEVEEVGTHELLEKVGEIMSIIDKVVIVKGNPSQVQNRASERALDSDTLLVFDDRKVLGYVRVLSPFILPRLSSSMVDL